MRWIASQIGAREHYAVPRVLHAAGKLESLYTDLWAGTMWQAMGSFMGRPVIPGGRYHKDLATARVQSFDITTLVDSLFGGELKKNPYDWFLYVGSDFGRSVVESLKKKKRMDWSEIIFFGYDTGFLEPAEWVKARGGKTIVCQMDPSRFEVDLVKEESKLWPGWSKRSVDVPEAYLQRREKEWAVADFVMVNSEWTRQALMKQGVSDDKIVVVPLAYESPKVKGRVARNLNCEHTAEFNSSTHLHFNEHNPMRVLFLGQVILRKGIQYLIEASKMLQNEPVIFDVVGPIGISEQALKSAPPNMTFHGPISRERAPEFFGAADLFVLPTLSDGFALTQLEAMAYGVPVITTPNCGQVVTDGMDGVIVPSGNAASIAAAITILASDRELLQRISKNCLLTSIQFNLKKLEIKLGSVEALLVQ